MNRDWLYAASIRAVKTMAQTMIAVIGCATALNEVDFRMVASSAILAGFLSILTSIAGLPEVDIAEDGDDDGNF